MPCAFYGGDVHKHILAATAGWLDEPIARCVLCPSADAGNTTGHGEKLKGIAAPPFAAAPDNLPLAQLKLPKGFKIELAQLAVLRLGYWWPSDATLVDAIAPSDWIENQK